MLKLQSRCLHRQTPAFARRAACRGRNLLTLAIETSCDDTSVALLETHRPTSPFPNQAHLHFHQKITANNTAYTGIHPIVAVESHQESLATLVSHAVKSLPHRKNPDFIAVTRGPGMRSSLATGLDTAKGLSLAWQIPLLGVNHMQAHALTPRLVSALQTPASTAEKPRNKPSFPFLTLLVSGGHTLLVHSRAVSDHAILASTSDVAVGDAIDKIARVVLPSEILKEAEEIMYGRLLERFAFPGGGSEAEYGYTAPSSRAEEIAKRKTKWGWALPVPLGDAHGGLSRGMKEFSFSGLDSTVRRICVAKAGEMSVEERRDLARESMRIAFEHLAIRACWALRELRQAGQKIDTLVVSGGVASNAFLRHVFKRYFAARGFEDVQLVCPPIELCTDNAAMIAWVGIEIWNAGWESELSVRALRKWSIDPSGEDGGILGVSGWKRRSGLEEEGMAVA